MVTDGDGEQAPPPGPDPAALQARIGKLEAENARLSQENSELLDIAESKAREASTAGTCGECGEEKTCPSGHGKEGGSHA